MSHLLYYIDCENMIECKIVMPKFKNFKIQLPVPFIIYADIESILTPSSNTRRHTSTYLEHIPFSIAYYFKCSFDENLNEYKKFQGEDCITQFN